MDEDLLDKYFAGQCTPEEASQVERWLDRPAPNEKRLLRQSWRGIHAHIRAGAIRPFGPWTSYLAAASVLLLMVAGVVWTSIPRHLELRNTSRTYDAFDARGLQLRLPPQATARVDLGMVSHSADLVFCGDVRIHNASGNDVRMKLNLQCAEGDPANHSTVLTVRKDRRYVAFRYHFKSDEVVVVEEDRLFDLPLPLQQKALKALKI
ncbi:hypothetical protein [Dyadobacter fermentans]|uniref:Uncharacterized protein n=1 Tax=Dyadobacter fermentans (strain ATCC 700827 / DSM 18053 / CIP 107007 / KCTC 52180 / NS114) TaxID=471854 RepID=C6W191_DYAFD|nr:hypothetical protein [Dyadobacter fermentans]ACT91948.1 hypothetical protein Dfer_0686 [Dyadobacter fermentans DSM 18053]